MSYFFFTSKKSVPEGAVLFTSLKPCHMCSGGIYDNKLNRVFYALDDPGQKTTVISDIEQKVSLDIFNCIDKKYLELKKENPGLNAAGSLEKMEEFAETIGEKLDFYKQTHPTFYSHIKNFWEIAVGKDLEI